MADYNLHMLAIYTGATACMRQLMCTAVSQLRSARPSPSLCTFDVPCMSIFLISAKHCKTLINALRETKIHNIHYPAGVSLVTYPGYAQ
jgi:TPP-dependent indolepyruvate ferredoxin oxidoreductase alpha subunit